MPGHASLLFCASTAKALPVPRFWRLFEACGDHYPKTDVVVPVVGIVPVTVRTAHIPCFIVEGTTTVIHGHIPRSRIAPTVA
jgi:hypothetical protein